MDDAERTLVVILAAALAVLLVLAIITIIKVIKLLNTLKSVADMAEQVADTAESITAALPKALSSLAVGRIVGRILKTMMNKKRTSKGGK